MDDYCKERGNISLIVAVFGSYLEMFPSVVCLVNEILASIDRIRGIGEIIIVLDGKIWRQAAYIDSLGTQEGVRIEWCEELHLPAALYNRGALLAEKPYLAFSYAGVEVSSWLDSIELLLSSTKMNGQSLVVSADPATVDKDKNRFASWRLDPSATWANSYESGWLEMVDYVPFTASLIVRDEFLQTGGFSCSPLLQRGFWWEFTLHASRISTIISAKAPHPRTRWDLYSIPLAYDYRLSGDLLARRVVRDRIDSAVKTSIDREDAIQLAADLNEEDRARLFRAVPVTTGSPGSLGHSGASGDRPLRITVLGGPYEPAHNQLCFYNFFSMVQGKGKITWRPILDSLAGPLDLIYADVVIFSRTKSQESVLLMNFCLAHAIPTIYMLDDNWFWVGKDWSEYSRMFELGSAFYQNFHHCAKNASVVLTYNEILAGDLRAIANNVIVLPTNINLDHFSTRTEGNDKLVIGYVGSKRYEASWVEALAHLAATRRDFRIFLMGNPPDGFEKLSHQVEVSFHPYVFGYRRYAKVLSNARPDILLAPLGDSRTEASKCPNKYLEITAAGAVGIYSNVEPYNQYIQTGKNGLLVDNKRESWVESIVQLMEDEGLRTLIKKNALEDVRKNFSTASILPNFLDLLKRTARANM